jgi:phosphoribosyl-AMP cyclohydrolase
MSSSAPSASAPGSVYEIEEGSKLLPRFDLHEALPCITLDAASGEVLMLGYMNREALDLTIKTRKATYWSRSRQKLWVKGEQSGLTQNVVEIMIDDDQDCVLLKVQVTGGASCHVGYRTCFYRKLQDGSASDLDFTLSEKVFDPVKVYGPSAATH